MPSQKNKKIFLYFFLFLFICTINNKDFNNFEFPKIDKIIVSGLSEKENLEFSKNMSVLKKYNLFSLSNLKLKQIIDNYNYIEEFLIFKRYPSTLDIYLQKAQLIAYVNKNGNNFYIGSNRKFIRDNGQSKNLPFIYGNLKINEFFELKNNIDESNFEFGEIKNLFFFISGRWDIETYSGIFIKLPKTQIKESLNLYLELINRKGFENIKTIDLRQNNQVIINE